MSWFEDLQTVAVKTEGDPPDAYTQLPEYLTISNDNNVNESAIDEEEEILFETSHSRDELFPDDRRNKRMRVSDENNGLPNMDTVDKLPNTTVSAPTSTVALTTRCSTKNIHQSTFAGLVNKNKTAFKPVVRVPHVPSQDIRRSYTTMWGNAFNLYDPKLLLKFLINHVRDDSTLVKAFPRGGSDLLSFPSHIQLHGKKDLLLYWLGVLLLSPDQVVLHDHVRIEPRKDGHPGSKITCRLQVRGTRPYSLTLAQLIDLVNNHVNAKLISQGKSVHELSDEEYMEELLQLDPYQCIGQIEQQVGANLVQPVTPGALNVVGTFTFLLDANKLIESMDYAIAPDTQSHKGYFEELHENTK